MRGIHPPKRHSCLQFTLLVLIRGTILHSLRLIVAEHRANHRRLHAKLHLIILALALLDFDTLLVLRCHVVEVATNELPHGIVEGLDCIILPDLLLLLLVEVDEFGQLLQKGLVAPFLPMLLLWGLIVQFLG